GAADVEDVRVGPPEIDPVLEGEEDPPAAGEAVTVVSAHAQVAAEGELERGASLPATGPGGAEDDGVARRRTRTPVAEELGIGEEVAPRLRAVPGVQVPPAVRAETASQEQLAHLRRRIEGERTEGLVVIRPARERATERDLDLVAEADVLLAAEGIEPLTLDPPHVPPPEEEEEPERIQLA